MPSTKFHREPFDEGTRTKLEIFQLYAREWLPVFLSKSGWRSIHVFDFFAGPGTDGKGSPGSPLRLVEEIKKARRPAAGNGPRVHLHLFDEDAAKVDKLRRAVSPLAESIRDLVPPDVQQLRFHDALERYSDVLSDSRSAKLLLIDQYGVDEVTAEVFVRLVGMPAADFLFFLSSSTLNRFRDHPAIKQKIDRPDDPHHVHRAALDYYRGLLPNERDYWLAPFSIRKGANIYGLIFGSAHPLGMDKFLEVAWRKDHINGEANFDINRDNLDSPQLPLFDRTPTKLRLFERDLDGRIRAGSVRSELDVIRICFAHGVRRSHATPVLQDLKRQGIIQLAFRTPDIKQRTNPRPIILLTR